MPAGSGLGDEHPTSLASTSEAPNADTLETLACLECERYDQAPGLMLAKLAFEATLGVRGSCMSNDCGSSEVNVVGAMMPNAAPMGDVRWVPTGGKLCSG